MRAFFGVAAMGVAAALAGCSARGIPETRDPGLAETAIAETAPERPLRLVFDWTILDGEARFSGRGAARIQPPLRARLDLFGPRGDGYLSAALVGSEIRLPPGVEAPQLPPPALMWAVLGAVAPPDGAALAGTRVEDGRAELHYDLGDDGRLRYTLQDGRLRQVLWEGKDRRMVVELRGSAGHGLPREAVYRDWSGYTELMLNLERVDEVEPYPPETWSPGG